MWSEKNSIALSQIAVKVFLGILVGCDVGGWWLVDWFWAGPATGPWMTLPTGCCFWPRCYAASVPACILLCLTRLLANISDGRCSFPQNVRALRSRLVLRGGGAGVPGQLLYYIPFLAVAVAAAFMALIIGSSKCVRTGHRHEVRAGPDRVRGRRVCPSLSIWTWLWPRRKIGAGELAEKVGITPANLSILKNNKAKAVRFSTLSALCRALDCQPADLLEYVPGEEEAEE